MSFVQISLPAARRDLTRLHMQPDANPQIPHLSNPNEPEPNPDSPPREFGRVSKQPEQRRAVSRSLHLLLLLLFLVAFLRINSNLFHSESRKPGIRYACTLLNRGVALTYDDGPSEHTERLLDSLAELEVKATFFLVGLNARKRPDVVRRMIRDGHTVGSHTMSHANLTKVYAENRTKFWEEVDGNSALLREITGQWPRYLRPPYGAIDRRVLKELNARGYEVVMWGGGCIDWWSQNASFELPIYVNGLPDSGTILCLHDTVKTTVEGVGELVGAIKSMQGWVNPQGRKIVSMDECLGSGY